MSYIAIYPSTGEVIDTDMDQALLIDRCKAKVSADGRSIEIHQRTKTIQLRVLAKAPVEVVDIP